MKKALVRLGLVTSATIATCMLPRVAIAASFTGLNVFGDSLVDSGNLFNVTSAFTSFGVPAVPPSPPYAQRSSNGPIWIDNIGEALGLSPVLASELALNPVAPPPTEGVNFAIAGALSSDAHTVEDDLAELADLLPGLADLLPSAANLLPGFLDQIDAFTALSTFSPANPDALYVVWVGGNDYNEAILNPTGLGDALIEQLPDAVTDNILSGLTQLSGLGAQEFLVVNLPSLGASPFASRLDVLTNQNVSTALSQLSDAHNELLAAKLNIFGQSQPEANVTLLDANTLFADVTANPEAFALTNATASCLTNFRPTFQFDGICDNPDEFLFWDDVHPTTAASQLISDLALAELNDDGELTAVPEPPLTALLLLGTAAGMPQVRRWLKGQK